jgi:AraC family transcriptional regulator
VQQQGATSGAELFGNSLETCNVSTFTLSERKYPPFFQTPSHAHENSLFCLVLGGSYTEISSQRTRVCQPSTFLFHAAGDPHAEHFHRSGGHSFIVEIPLNRSVELPEKFNSAICSSMFSNGNIPLLGRRLYEEFKHFDKFSSLIIEGLVYEIFGEVCRQTAVLHGERSPIWLKTVEELLREKFNERLTLAEIAETVGVHPVHLAQSFRRHYQMTIGGFVRRLRLERSRRQLLDTDQTLAEIALGSGFSDQSHFTRLFKAEFGQTPNAFRQNN